MRKREPVKGRKGSTGRNGNSDIWLFSHEVARLEGLTRVAVDWRCRHGLYQKVRKVKSHGGGSKGGQRWQIALSDPKISRLARHLFHLRRIIIPELRDIIVAEIKANSSQIDSLEKMIDALQKDLG